MGSSWGPRGHAGIEPASRHDVHPWPSGACRAAQLPQVLGASAGGLLTFAPAMPDTMLDTMLDTRRSTRLDTTSGRATKMIAVLALAATLPMGALGCKGEGRGKSDAAEWIDSPSSATKNGEKLVFPQLGVQFERPTTLYVFKNCGEASHSMDGALQWVPVVTCSSSGGDAFGGDEEEEADPFAEEEAAEDGAEPIDLTFYVTRKTRPLDERAVSWFENQYKQQGLNVDEISFQHDYNKKQGLYFKLQVVDASTNTPTREIIQFMFPREDVVFIARMEYPFGESRSVDADWNRLLWNFDWASAASGEGGGG